MHSLRYCKELVYCNYEYRFWYTDIIFFGLCPSSYFIIKYGFSDGGSASVFREVKYIIC